MRKTFLVYEYMRPLELSAYRLAKELGVSIPTVNEIVRRRRGVTAEMALRFSRYFRTTPQLWQDLQAQYDLALASREIGISLKAIRPLSRSKLQALRLTQASITSKAC